MTIWAILPAAGIGRRMGSSAPKQYLDLNGEPVIAHSLRKLAAIPAVRKIVVVLHPDDTHFADLHLADADRIVAVAGGDERFQSVCNGLEHLAGVASDDDWVLVHDAVRPCVRISDINTLLDTLAHHHVGGVLGVPVDDTLKLVNDKAEVEQTPDRSRYWQAQTPQLFRYGLLVKALAVLASEARHVTDEAGAVERLGLQPQMVAGHKDNIKITHATDLALASYILQSQGL